MVKSKKKLSPLYGLIVIIFGLILLTLSCSNIGKWEILDKQYDQINNEDDVEQLPTPTPSPAPSDIIINMVVNDSAYAVYWSIRTNLQIGDEFFGDRTYFVNTLPPTYAGSVWIRTAADSKNYTDPILVTFTVTADAEVLIVHDNRIDPKPTWLSSDWTDTGDDIIDSLGVDYSVFTRNYLANSSVTLGPNGDTTVGYSIIIK